MNFPHSQPMAAQEERERQENVENCQRVAEKRSSDVELVSQAQFESVRCLVESADAFGTNLQWKVAGGVPPEQMGRFLWSLTISRAVKRC